MKKRAIISFSLLLIILVATLVLAVGGGGGGDPDTNSNPEEIQATTITQIADCEAPTMLRERVRCRITARASTSSIEESCRVLSSEKRTACIALQNRASPCYDETASDKALCLRRNAGLGAGQLNRFAAEDRREYAALLMYELQERIEKKHEQGQLTDDESAQLITSLIEIKQSLLKGEPIADVRVKMTSFKQAYLEAMSQ